MDYTSTLETYFSGKSFPKDQVLEVTIVAHKLEEVGRNKEPRPILMFKEDTRKLILNKTSYARLANAHGGSRNADDWVGAVISITYDPDVTFAGNVVGGLKVSVKHKAPKRASATAK
jgi:hypothetical protein